MPYQRNIQSWQQWLKSVSTIAVGGEPAPTQHLQTPAALGRQETLNWMQSRTLEEREFASRQLAARIAEAEVRIQIERRSEAESRIHTRRQCKLTQRLEIQVSSGPDDFPPVLPEFTPEGGFESLSSMILSDPMFQGAPSNSMMCETSPELSPASPAAADMEALCSQGLESREGVPDKPLPALPAALCPQGPRSRGIAPMLVAIRSRRNRPAGVNPPPPRTCRCGAETNRKLASELASYLSIPSCTGAEDVLLHVLEHPRTQCSLARLQPQAATRFNSISWAKALGAPARGCPERCRGVAPRLLPGWVRAIYQFPHDHMMEVRQIIQQCMSLFPTETDERRSARVACRVKAWEQPCSRNHLAGVAGVFDAGMALRIRRDPSRSHRKAVAHVKNWTPPGRSPLCISWGTPVDL
ncbi:hypothetical protein RB594_005291 [Gaeumannomyces avenae]